MGSADSPSNHANRRAARHRPSSDHPIADPCVTRPDPASEVRRLERALSRTGSGSRRSGFVPNESLCANTTPSSSCIESIKQLEARYCAACAACDDGYDPDRLAALFTEDAVWDGGNPAVA